MDALPPSLPNTGIPQPVPAGMAGLAILLADLSQTLAKLPVGAQIPALVTQILPQAQSQQPQSLPDPAAPKAANAGPLLLLSTPDGPAQVRVPANLQIPPGAKLEIAVVAAGPQPQWRLTAIDGRPVAPGPAPTPVSVSLSATPTPAAASAPSVTPTDSAPRPTPAPGIPATLVKSTDPALPSGTTLLVRITALTLPPQPQAQLQAPPQIQAQAPAQPVAELEEEPRSAPPPVATAQAQAPTPTTAPSIAAAPIAAPAAAAPVAAPMSTSAPAPAPSPTTVATSPLPTVQPQTQPAPSLAPAPTQAPAPASIAPLPSAAPAVPTAPTPVAASAPTPAPAPVPTAAPLPAEIGGEVLPNTDAGRPLLKTPVGLLALTVDPQSAPPTGAHVTLTVIGKPVPPAAPILPPPPDDPPDKALPRRLSQLVDQLQSGGNDKLAEAVRQAIPAPGPKLAAQLLSVIASAEPSQGLPRFLGDGLINALTHSAPEAMAQMSRQWEAISQPVQGPDAGEWRSLLLPLMMGGQMNLLRLTTRQHRRGASPAEREKGTRFLLDLDLSRLGPMQLDGLVKRQHKRFDLIIRTKEPLSGEMRRDIDGLFLNGLVNFGLQGSIGFQPEGSFIATPPLTGDTNGIIFA